MRTNVLSLLFFSSLIIVVNVMASINIVGTDNNLDVTSKVINPEFDNGVMIDGAPTGWTQNINASTSKISTSAKGDGTVIKANQNHWQIWNSSGVMGKAYQTISNLPNGKYKVRVGLVATFGGSVLLYANEGTTAIPTTANGSFEATGTVTNGSLELGLNIATSADATTIELDHVQLFYYESDITSYAQVLSGKLVEAIADTSNNENPGYFNLTQLRDAIINTQTVKQDSVSLIHAIAQIDVALVEYNNIHAAYEPLNKTIKSITAQLAASNYPDKSEFINAIATAEILYRSTSDQRANLKSVVNDLIQKSKILEMYSQLDAAVVNANNFLSNTDYPGKSSYEAAIAAAQDVLNKPDSQDILLKIESLKTAKTDYYNSQFTEPAVKQLISYVDTNLKDSEKFVLRVDGKPFYMTNIQIRLDKLKGFCNFDAAARDSVVKRAALDGFNTVSIPIQWREIEPSKDVFDWTVIDEYMGLCKKYGLKMEMLWFSWSSGGRIQWLNRNEIRTPDYVCSIAGTSEFKILRTMDPWTLDWFDTRLRDRETYILGQLMEHIAVWDANNGKSHTIVGIQLGNEARGYSQTVSAAQIVDYYNNVGAAVKNSKYIVWTRLNCVSSETLGRINANEALRANGGTNIDFVGIDIYGTSAASIKTDNGGQLPSVGKNYAMIMESGAEVSSAAIYQMAALAGNKAYDHYDMAGTDGHELYDRNGLTLVPHGSYIRDVRAVNKIMNLDNVDISLKAHGAGLFVYNYAGNTIASETGIEGISFTPDTANTQAIAIRRSASEIVLLSTRGGTFTYPTTLGIVSASKGYFDSNNNWISEGNINVTAATVAMPVNSAVRLLTKAEVVGDVIKNPSFEEGLYQNSAGYVVPNSWNMDAILSGADVQLKNGDALSGVYRYYIWGNAGSSVDFYQNIVLPAGEYTLKAGLRAKDPNATYLYASIGSNTTKTAVPTSWSTWLIVPNTFVVPDNNSNVRIGVSSSAAVIIDNFQLLKATGGSTAIENVSPVNKRLHITSRKDGVILSRTSELNYPSDIKIYNITGQMIHTINMSFNYLFVPLITGIYLIDNQKVIVK